MSKNILTPLSIIIGGLLIGGAFLFGIKSGNTSAPVDVAQANLRKVDLEIKNMFCVGCRSSVVNSVMALSGVVQADADPRTDSGWVIYDSDTTTKEQIVAASIFQAYPARILGDSAYTKASADRQKYSDNAQQVAEVPPEIEQKLNLLAKKLQERNVEFEPFFQKELDDAISGGYWDKANNLLDNFLQSYE